MTTFAREFPIQVFSPSCRRQRQDISAPSRVPPRPFPGGRKQSGKFGQVSPEEVCLPREGLAFAARKRNINFPSGSSVSPLAALFISASNRRKSDRKFPRQYFTRAESRRKFQRLTVVFTLTKARKSTLAYFRDCSPRKEPVLISSNVDERYTQAEKHVYHFPRLSHAISGYIVDIGTPIYNDGIIKMLYGRNEM